MLPFRNILFPVDYSPRCHAAAVAVAKMADHFGASITLVHSYQVPVVIYGEFMPISMPAPEDWQAIGEKTITRFAAEAFPDRKVTTVVEANDPAAAIRKTVQRMGADLVMMPASGHGPVRRLLLGSVTAKVLHDVGCPIWTSHEVMAGPPYKSIVCAVSSGAEAADVIRASALIAKAFDAKLTVMHAVDARSAVLETEYGPYRKMLMDAAENHLRGILREQGLEVPLSVWDGDVASCLKDEVEKRGADLIITGRGHAQGMLGSLWSHLNAIARSAHCPVLSL